MRTQLMIITTVWLVDSIDGVAEHTALDKEWVGLILVPLIGNAAEHLENATTSMEDKLTLSIDVAAGSSIVRHCA